AVFLAVLPVLGPPRLTAQAAATDLLPSESDLATAFAPFAPLKVASFAQGLGTEGWDSGQTVQVDGGPAGLALVSLDAAELPSNAGAACFLQTRLQQQREASTKDNMAGDLGRADAKLTGDAYGAYFGVFVSPHTAQDRAVMAVLIARYEN